MARERTGSLYWTESGWRARFAVDVATDGRPSAASAVEVISMLEQHRAEVD